MSTPDGDNVGDRLGALRRRRGLTQETLAGRAGVAVSTIRKLEQGDRQGARLTTLHTLARALGVETSALFEPGVPGPMGEASDAPALNLVSLRRVLAPARGIPSVSFTDESARAAPSDIADLRAALSEATRLYGEDEYAAAIVAVPELISSARATVSELGSDEAQEILVHALQLAGSLLTQLRHYDLAYYPLAEAIDIANAAGNTLLAGSAVISLCWLFMRQGRLGETERMATATADAMEPKLSKATSREISTWGWLLLRGSAAAIRNNQPDEADDMMRLAAAAAARIGPSQLNYHEYWTTFDPATVAMKRVENAVIIGDSRRALQLAENVPGEGQPTSNNRNRHLLDVASAHTSQREYSEAVDILSGIRRDAPQWLEHQRMARDVLSHVLARRARQVTADMRGLADFLRIEG